jgi:hypothetical protein
MNNIILRQLLQLKEAVNVQLAIKRFNVML